MTDSKIITTSVISQADIDRFMSYVQIQLDTDAWLWTGGISSNGYGAFWYQGATVSAHRFSYLIRHGYIPDQWMVCHKHEELGKHNVNPDHLFIGTHKDNMQDAAEKGRMPYGSDNAASKITPADAHAIVNDTRTVEIIGQQYGISGVAVSKIKRGDIWQSITGVEKANTHNLKNKSGYPGVRWKKGKWEASLQWRHNGRQMVKYLGRYDDPVNASNAYLAAKKVLTESRT